MAYKLLYVSPERLESDLVRERIKKMNVKDPNYNFIDLSTVFSDM